ncbi:MAG: ectonucleotide pyrophosphatase/phosphodiesterase [Bacteroidales bacterium]|jgi:alkaline phosphatase D|nr:ectonucleotide pyrophosphatase/phosphodiesterase [Bacteroidales bacterium]
MSTKAKYSPAQPIRLLVLFILVISGTVICGFGNRKKTKEPQEYLLVVSFDAFRADYHTHYNTPNLNRLATDGVKAGRMYSSFPTNTFPNHYTIATGLYPDHHGLINNSFYAPDLDRPYGLVNIMVYNQEIGRHYRIDRSSVEDAAFYGGEPMWVTAEKHGLKSAAFFWVGSEAPVGGIYPSYWKQYNPKIPFAARIDTVVKWLGYPDHMRPRLVNLYFEEPDATSHAYGPISNATGALVEKLDSLLGDLRTKLAALPIANKINLIVLSDHGMASVSPNRYINLKAVVPERMISGVSGGTPFLLVSPAAGKADSILMLINRTTGIRAWKKLELPARWHYGSHPRIPEIVVLADSSWSIGMSDRPSTNRGAHGYDNRNPELHSIFYAAGPSFRKNYRIEEMNNVDVYNIVCRILGITPAPNDGNMEVAEKIMKR